MDNPYGWSLIRNNMTGLFYVQKQSSMHGVCDSETFVFCNRDAAERAARNRNRDNGYSYILDQPTNYYQ